MHNSSVQTLYESIQSITQNVINSADLCGIFYGTVTSVKPLEIMIEQKMSLTEKHLVLTTNVVDYEVDITVDHVTEEEPVLHGHAIEHNGTETAAPDITHFHRQGTGMTESESPATAHTHQLKNIEIKQSTAAQTAHSHAYQGRKTFLVHNGLKMGEKVLLVRAQGGQRYVVLDRVRLL